MKIINFIRDITLNFWVFLKKEIDDFPWHMGLLITLIFAGVFLRFYNISNTLMFQSDQGRDAMIVADIFRKADPVLIGPVTSVGNMYLGPLYYYMMLVPLMLTYPSPMGPAYMVALLSVTTIILIYFLGKKMIGRNGALIAAGMYTFSAIAITYARFSWNPNPAPIMMILWLYFIFLAVKKKDWAWILVILMDACLIQLHYVNLLVVAASGLIWLYCLIERIRNSDKKKLDLSVFIKSTLIGAFIFIILMSPILVFDLRHGGLNAKSFLGIVTKEESFTAKKSPVDNDFFKSIKEVDGRSQHVIGVVGFAENDQAWLKRFLVLFVLIGLITILVVNTKYEKNKLYREDIAGTSIILLITLLITVLGISFYKNSVFDHYILFTNVLVFMSFGLILSKITKNIWGKIFTSSLLIFFVWLNINNYDYLDLSSPWTKNSEVANQIAENIDGEYALVLIGPSNDSYAQNYRYFLETLNKPPLKPEYTGEAEKMVIIDEYKVENFDWTYLDNYEIKVFEPKRIFHSFQTKDNGPNIYILDKISNETSVIKD